MDPILPYTKINEYVDRKWASNNFNSKICSADNKACASSISLHSL